MQEERSLITRARSLGCVREVWASREDYVGEGQGAHHANVRTQLSKGLYFLAMSFPREGCFANKFIAYREEVYDDFSR